MPEIHRMPASHHSGFNEVEAAFFIGCYGIAVHHWAIGWAIRVMFRSRHWIIRF